MASHFKRKLMTTTAIAFLAMSVSGFASEPAKAIERVEIELEEQPLREALNTLAQKYNKQIVYISGVTEGLTAKKLDGNYSVEEAFGTILDETPLEFRIVNERTISVAPKSTGNNASAPQTSQPAQPTSDTPDDSNIADEFEFGLEEIVITAQKRAQDLQEVPVAVSAFSVSFLEERGLNDFRDVSRFTPGFTASFFSSSEPIFAIRGANNTFSQAGASKPVGVFLDDVFISRNTASAFELFDIEQVTVLRGPQGTLFGRNVTGGALVINTSKPNLEETTGKFQAQYGNYDQLALRGTITGPLSDTVAAKISASYRARDGFSTDRLLNREQDDHNSFNIRGQLLFQPSDVFDALLTFDYSTDSNNGRSLSTIAPAGANDGDRRTSESGVPQEFERDTYGIAAHLNYHADHGTFTSISAFRESDSSDFFSFSSTNFSLLPSFNPFFPFQQLALNEDNPKTFSQELRYVSDFNGPVSLVAGLYYFYEDILRNANSTRFAGQSGNTLRDRTFVQDIQTNSFAAYTDIEIELSETVSLNVGGRYTWEEKEGQVALVDDLNPANNFSTPQFSDSFSDFSPRFVLNWKPTEDLLVYGSFTQGFTSGGFNTEEDTIAVVTNPFDPETVDAYEIGLKTELFDRRVRANITAFRQEFNNKQEGFLDPTFNFVILNASEATIEGFEVELNWSVNEYLNLFGSYAYLDARFTDFTIPGNTPQDRSGNRLATSPENSFSFGGDASIPVGDSGSLFVNSSYTYQSEYFTGADNRPTFLIDGFGLWNAAIGYEPDEGNWRIEAFMQNISDKQFVLVRSDFFGGLDLGESLGAPRTYGVRLTGSF